VCSQVLFNKGFYSYGRLWIMSYDCTVQCRSPWHMWLLDTYNVAGVIMDRILNFD
jgi:hypothetical protein